MTADLTTVFNEDRKGMILSSNTKTGRAINFPIVGHCRPSKICYNVCYARRLMSAYPSVLPKSKWVSQYLLGNDLSRIVEEIHRWARPSVRISATGDMLPKHADNLIRIADACTFTMFWGMTRKIEIAKKINGAKLRNLCLLVSLDASTTDRKLLDYDSGKCWLKVTDKKLKELNIPIRHDIVPDDKKIITVFPTHSAGKIMKSDLDRRDCPVIRGKIEGCWVCGRCWLWAPWVNGREFLSGDEMASFPVYPSAPKPKNW